MCIAYKSTYHREDRCSNCHIPLAVGFRQGESFSPLGFLLYACACWFTGLLIAVLVVCLFVCLFLFFNSSLNPGSVVLCFVSCFVFRMLVGGLII